MRSSSTMADGHKVRHRLKKTRPNIVIIMTDDQDIELGKWLFIIN